MIKVSDEFVISRTVKRECSLSPTFFSMYSDFIYIIIYTNAPLFLQETENDLPRPCA